jgi:hypothetical protein
LILNEDTPYYVRDLLDTPGDANGRLLQQQGQGQGHYQQQQQQGQDHNQQQQGHQDGQWSPPSPPEDKVAKLVLNRVHIQESNAIEEWYQLTIDYAAYWPSQGTGRAPPIEDTQVLLDITTTVYETISASIESDDFWTTLEGLDFGQDLLLHHPSYDALYELDDKGLCDCQMVPNEYDLRPYHYGGSEDYDGELGDVADENIIPEDGGIWDDNNNNKMNNGTYPDLIGTAAADIVWTMREYVGLGMFVTTIVVTSILAVVGVAARHRQRRKQLWGATLTENGINELLRVGWRYTVGDPANGTSTGQQEQQQQHHQQQQQQQLFLQVYDKGRMGYNDENSLLHGGVERYNLNTTTSDAAGQEDGLNFISAVEEEATHTQSNGPTSPPRR